ncbi:MAG: histidine phosphatase family protein [Caulobacteraceae bacterium]
MDPIWLIRHGRPSTQWGGADSDPGLAAEGLRQAEEVAAAFLALPKSERPVLIVSSPLARCRQTAQPLADALCLPVEIEPKVGEIAASSHLAPDDRGAWLRAALAGRWADIAGDIDYEEWRRGVHAAVATRPHAAIFSHFVAINAVLSVIESSEMVTRFRPDHASVTRLGLRAGEISILERGREAAIGVA